MSHAKWTSTWKMTFVKSVFQYCFPENKTCVNKLILLQPLRLLSSAIFFSLNLVGRCQCFGGNCFLDLQERRALWKYQKLYIIQTNLPTTKPKYSDNAGMKVCIWYEQRAVKQHFPFSQLISLSCFIRERKIRGKISAQKFSLLQRKIKYFFYMFLVLFLSEHSLTVYRGAISRDTKLIIPLAWSINKLQIFFFTRCSHMEDILSHIWSFYNGEYNVAEMLIDGH